MKRRYFRYSTAACIEQCVIAIKKHTRNAALLFAPCLQWTSTCGQTYITNRRKERHMCVHDSEVVIVMRWVCEIWGNYWLLLRTNTDTADWLHGCNQKRLHPRSPWATAEAASRPKQPEQPQKLRAAQSNRSNRRSCELLVMRIPIVFAMLCEFEWESLLFLLCLVSFNDNLLNVHHNSLNVPVIC